MFNRLIRLLAFFGICGWAAGLVAQTVDTIDPALKARIDDMIAERVKAREAKDWATADRIRAELTALNVEVMDSAEGATWRIREPAPHASE